MTVFPKVLLVIKSSDLRQLYHEILISEHIEVIVADNVTDSLLQLILHKDINLMVIDTGFIYVETERLLKIIERNAVWKKRPLILLDYVDSSKDLKHLLVKFEKVEHVSSHLISPGELVNLVKELM